MLVCTHRTRRSHWNALCICYTIGASGLPDIHEWLVYVGHEGGARVVYRKLKPRV